MPIGAAVAGAAVAGIAGSVISANAAEDAAQTQANAAMRGQDIQQAMFNKIQQNLLPYMNFGQQGLDILQGSGPTNLTSLTTPWQPTMAQLASTPGYQFTLQQGEQSVNNALSAQGLANNNTPGSFSGPGAKAAINYAEGLASTTYNQQFQNYLAQNQQIYNMLTGVVGSGQNAAAGLGGFGANLAQGQAQLAAYGGAAQAAGQIGAANAISGGLGSAGNSLTTLALLNSMNNGGTTFGAGNSALSLANNTPTAATLLTPD